MSKPASDIDQSRQAWIKAVRERAGQARANAADRSNFYDNSRRQEPSLPKLKFLEGKDE
jgi:hypothetical protein